MLFQAMALTFVIFTSLVGTFFIAITVYELLLSKEVDSNIKVTITEQNQDKAEYLIRTALFNTDKYVEVVQQTNDPEVDQIVEFLANESGRIIKLI